jgi:hypothetical protein
MLYVLRRLEIIVIYTFSCYKGVKLAFISLRAIILIIITLIVLFEYLIVFYFIILAKLA